VKADLVASRSGNTDVHPGVTPQLRHLASTSHGLTGTATCTGTVNGKPVTGPGSFAVNTEVVGNCTQANGSSTFVLRIPTTGGTKTVAIIAAVGDCVTTPITQTTSVITAHIT
jgi:hypothetical protein